MYESFISALKRTKKKYSKWSNILNICETKTSTMFKFSFTECEIQIIENLKPAPHKLLLRYLNFGKKQRQFSLQLKTMATILTLQLFFTILIWGNFRISLRIVLFKKKFWSCFYLNQRSPSWSLYLVIHEHLPDYKISWNASDIRGATFPCCSYLCHPSREILQNTRVFSAAPISWPYVRPTIWTTVNIRISSSANQHW